MAAMIRKAIFVQSDCKASLELNLCNRLMVNYMFWTLLYEYLLDGIVFQARCIFFEKKYTFVKVPLLQFRNVSDLNYYLPVACDERYYVCSNIKCASSSTYWTSYKKYTWRLHEVMIIRNST